MESIGIIDKQKVNLKRIDVAIGSNINFKEEFKFLLFLFELVTFRDEKSDKWYTTNLNTLENNSIIQKGRSVEICFYDKNEESNGRHLMNTRMEWRFKRISSKDYNLHFEKVIDNINYIEKNIENLEKNMADRLIKLWDKEKIRIQSFSEFVRKYERYFYTSEILGKVYFNSGLVGSYENWLNKFRRNNHIKFYFKKDISDFKKIILKSINEYLEN